MGIISDTLLLGFLRSNLEFHSINLISYHYSSPVVLMDPIPDNVVRGGFTVDFSDNEDDLRAATDLSLIGRIFWSLPKPLNTVLQAMARL